MRKKLGQGYREEKVKGGGRGWGDGGGGDQRRGRRKKGKGDTIEKDICKQLLA